MNRIAINDRPALLGRLAERICGFGSEAVSAKALAVAKAGILDTVGVTLAGLDEGCTRILLDTPGVATAPGDCLILGTARRTSALDAALVNGTASHALDYDDFCDAFGGHQSVPLVPALFALAEERRLSGAALLTAYVVGVETEIRLARAVHPVHYDKGWHPTSTLGVFGAAAAAARLLELDPERTALALAIAASLAAGLKANFGTMTKPLHVGHCGRSGVLAVLLAERGFDANPGAMEHHQGFFNVFNGAGQFDAERLLAGWGGALELEEPTMGIKQFPCCGSTHAAIAMMLRLVREEGITAADVAGIEVLMHGRRLRHTDTPLPESPLQAKFSVQYGVVRALLDRAVRLEHFEGDAFAEPEVRRLLGLTRADVHPEWGGEGGHPWGAEVAVALTDGRRLVRGTEHMVGRSGDNAMTVDELREKFADCAGRAVPVERIGPLFEALLALETVADVADLARLMEGTADT